MTQEIHNPNGVRSTPYVGDTPFIWVAECTCGWYTGGKHLSELSATKALSNHITAKTQNQ